MVCKFPKSKSPYSGTHSFLIAMWFFLLSRHGPADLHKRTQQLYGLTCDIDVICHFKFRYVKGIQTSLQTNLQPSK